MSHQLVPIDRIFSKIVRDISDDFNEGDVIEWCGEALEHIGTERQYEESVCFMEVVDYQCAMPKGTHNIIQIARDNGWNKMACNSWCPSIITQSVTPISSIEELPSIPVALDGNGTPLNAYDIAYYRPIFDFKYGYTGWSNSNYYTNNYTPVRLKNHSFFGSLVCENSQSNSGSDEYTIINSSVLRFSFRSGFVAIAVNKQALDENGYPMIPDKISHITAITKYVTMMMFQKEYYKGRDGAKGKMDKAESDWQWYCGQAANSDFMPHGIDEYQNLLDQRSYLLPRNNRYFSFFGNLAKPENRRWNNRFTAGNETGIYNTNDSLTPTIAETCSPSKNNNSTSDTIIVNNIIGNSSGGSVRKPLIGITGRGLINDPITNANYYQNDSLKGLGSEIRIDAEGVTMTNFGINKAFEFNPVTGRIDFLYDYIWVLDTSIWVDLNQ